VLVPNAKLAEDDLLLLNEGVWPTSPPEEEEGRLPELRLEGMLDVKG
jgi:hypothetical protein